MASKKPTDIVKPVPMASGPVLIALASLRNTEAQLRWQGAQWAITLNVSAMVALMYRLLTIPDSSEIITLAIGCVIVAGLDFVWYNMLRRDGKFLDFWNKKILEHEKANSIDGGMKIFTSSIYQKLSQSRDRLQQRLERITVIFIIAWAVAPIILIVWLFVLKGGVQWV